MKYKTIGAFKNVQNIPYCKASVDLKIGMGVIVNRATKSVSLAADTAGCKTITYIVSNIIDKPEVGTLSDYKIKSGEYVRCDDLKTVAGLEIELSSAEISTVYANLAAGDTLVFGTDGKLEEVADVTGYAVYFTIIEKTGYTGSGVRATINA